MPTIIGITMITILFMDHQGLSCVLYAHRYMLSCLMLLIELQHP